MKSCSVFSIFGAVCTTALVCIAAPPSNDDFTNAIVLTGSSITFTGSLAEATWDASEPYALSYMNSVWWRWTAPDNTAVTIEVIQNEVIPCCSYKYIEFFRGTNLFSLILTDYTPLELLSGTMALKRYLSFVPNAGETYYIRAAARGGSTDGFIVLRLTTTNPPIILTQPEDAFVGQFGTALFRVVAAGV